MGLKQAVSSGCGQLHSQAGFLPAIVKRGDRIGTRDDFVEVVK